MPIKGLSEVRRLPRLGKIRLGVKEVPAPPKKPYPKAVDYFVCPPEVQEVYPGQPRELRIMLPVEDEAIFAPQWYRCYSGSRGLICRGNGDKADRTFDKATGALATQASTETERREDYPCLGQDCPEYQKKQCRRVMNFQFMLPDVPGLGVWQLDTSSFYSIVAVNSGVALIRAICGRVAMIPLVLSVRPQEVTPEGGKKKTVYVLQLTADVSLAEIQRLAQIPASRVMLPAPEPPEEEQTPDDLFPCDNSGEDNSAQHDPGEAPAAQVIAPTPTPSPEASKLPAPQQPDIKGQGKVHPVMASEAQHRAMKARREFLNMTEDDLNKLSAQLTQVELDALSVDQAAQVIANLDDLIKAKRAKLTPR